MRKTSVIFMVVVCCGLCAEVAQAAGGPGAPGQDVANQANNYVSRVLMPLFNCFATNYNTARSARDSRSMSQVRQGISQCTMGSTLAPVQSPDGGGESIRSQLTSLLQRLSTAAGQLENAFRQQENARGKNVEKVDVVGMDQPMYRESGDSQDRVYNNDPRGAYDNNVTHYRNTLINLGEDFERLKQDLDRWTKEIQQRLNQAAQQPGGGR